MKTSACYVLKAVGTKRFEHSDPNVSKDRVITDKKIRKTQPATRKGVFKIIRISLSEINLLFLSHAGKDTRDDKMPLAAARLSDKRVIGESDHACGYLPVNVQRTALRTRRMTEAIELAGCSL